jgi:hypothetical protein
MLRNLTGVYSLQKWFTEQDYVTQDINICLGGQYSESPYTVKKVSDFPVRCGWEYR